LPFFGFDVSISAWERTDVRALLLLPLLCFCMFYLCVFLAPSALGEPKKPEAEN